MEASAGVLRRFPSVTGTGVGISNNPLNRSCRFSSVSLKLVKKELVGCEFYDEGCLEFSSSGRGGIISCGKKKKEKDMGELKKTKKKMKLLKGLTRNFSNLNEMGLGFGYDVYLVDQVQGKTISEVAELLLGQLQQLKAEEKELKRKRKEEKAQMKMKVAASQVQSCTRSCAMSSSSSSSLTIFLLAISMAGSAPEGSQFDARQFDVKMTELLGTEQQEFFTSYDEVYDSFDAMGLQENLLRGSYAYGFAKPSAIQQRGIVPFCKGLDVIQQEQSGTGKTATFCSGVLQQLDYSLVECQALVLAPTRELAQQIKKVMRALGDYLCVKVHACVGGTSVREDQRILQSGVHVVVGTPCRVFDMLRRQSPRLFV